MQQFTWIFSLLQPVGPEIAQRLEQDFEAFQAQWKSHGTPVGGLIRLLHDRFVVIQAKDDEDRPSGCSIDSLRRGVTAILEQRGLGRADGGEVFYRNEQGDIEMVHFQKISQLVESGALCADSLVFDHSMNNTDDLSNWEVAMKHTWMKRYLPSDKKQKV